MHPSYGVYIPIRDVSVLQSTYGERRYVRNMCADHITWDIHQHTSLHTSSEEKSKRHQYSDFTQYPRASILLCDHDHRSREFDSGNNLCNFHYLQNFFYVSRQRMWKNFEVAASIAHT